MLDVPRFCAVLQHLLHGVNLVLIAVLGVILAGVKQTGDGGGRDGGTRASAARGVAIGHAAVRSGAGANIFHGLFNDLFGHGNSGVAAAPQSLDLGDRGRAFIEVAAVFRADIAPAAGRGLGLAGELDGIVQDVNQFLAAIGVLFFAQHLGKEEHRETVSVGVAGILARADQAGGLVGMADQVVHGALDIGGVLALRGGRTLAQQGRGRKRRDGGRVAALGSRPMAQPRLPPGEPIQAAGDRAVDVPVAYLVRAPGPPRQRQNGQSRGEDDNSHVFSGPIADVHQKLSVPGLNCFRSVLSTFPAPCSHCLTPAAPSTASKRASPNLPAGFFTPVL